MTQRRKSQESLRGGSPQLLTQYRFLRRCHQRRIWEALSQSRGRLDPVQIVFWRHDRQIRVLAIMPNGDMQQAVAPYMFSSGGEVRDSYPRVCYTRWFWEELAGAAQARRLGMYEIAFQRVNTARRMRDLVEQHAAIDTVQYLETAE